MRKYPQTERLVHSVRQLHPNVAVDIEQAAEEDIENKKEIEPCARIRTKEFGRSMVLN